MSDKEKVKTGRAALGFVPDREGAIDGGLDGGAVVGAATNTSAAVAMCVVAAPIALAGARARVVLFEQDGQGSPIA